MMEIVDSSCTGWLEADRCRWEMGARVCGHVGASTTREKQVSDLYSQSRCTVRWVDSLLEKCGLD